MRILVVGGSGYLGTLVNPHLKHSHTLRIFDLNPPADVSLEYMKGNVCDPTALAGAVQGMDAILYMAMGSYPARNSDDQDRMQARITAFDVNVKGLHLALDAAHNAGVTHAVYTSSMSVYVDNGVGRNQADEDTPPDAVMAYGLTKYLGEEVCRHACRAWGMRVNALRLYFPLPETKWQEKASGRDTTPSTTAGDTARALLAALDYRAGFEVFTISGDYEQKLMSLVKAKRLLGWEPLARPNALPEAEKI